jgi:hypothetical protein
MLPVKLFAGASAVFAALAIVLKMAGPVSIFGNPNVYVTFVYGSFSRWHVVVLGAVVCGVFAALYFVCERSLRYPMNDSLSLANFVLIVGAFVLLISFLYSAHSDLKVGNDPRTIRLMLFFLVMPVVCFLFGCVLFVANSSWTVIRALRHQ